MENFAAVYLKSSTSSIRSNLHPAPPAIFRKDSATNTAVAITIRRMAPARFKRSRHERTKSVSVPQSRLWLYNLHYFEQVDEPLIERWIAENTIEQGVGWDPYPTSLRIAN
jgi:hypothetical protein